MLLCSNVGQKIFYVANPRMPCMGSLKDERVHSIIAILVAPYRGGSVGDA